MTPAPEYQCDRCGRQYWRPQRYCSTCGSARIARRLRRPRKESRSVVAVGLVGVALALGVVAWLALAGSNASYGGGGGPTSPAAVGSYLMNVPRSPSSPASAQLGFGTGEVAGLSRYAFPNRGIEFQLPRTWTKVDEGLRQALTREVGDDLDSEGIELLSVYTDEPGNMVLMAVTETAPSADYDVSGVEIKGRMIVDSLSDSPGSKVGLNVETVSGRVILISDAFRQEGAYGRVLVLFGGHRMLCFIAAAESAATCDAAVSRLRLLVGYMKVD